MTTPMPDLVRRFYDEIWNARDRTAIADLLTEDFRFRGSLGRVCEGREAFREYVDSVHEALGDYRCEIVELVSERDRAFARMTFSGVHRGVLLGHEATGKRVSWAGAALFHAKGGKLASLWVLGDLDGLRRELRADPWILRRATSRDADVVAGLHAASWKSAYRGVLTDEYLDTRVVDERQTMWRQRFSSRDSESFLVLVALRENEPLAFVCMMLDEDPEWGALLDNLHVHPDWKGKGIGRKLTIEAAGWVNARRPGSPIHLWVIENNREARSFYERLAGRPQETKLWLAPDGSSVRLIRYVWNDPTCVE